MNIPKEEEEKKKRRKKDPTHIQSIITAVLQQWFEYLMRLVDKESEWHDTETEQKQNKNKQRIVKV